MEQERKAAEAKAKHQEEQQGKRVSRAMSAEQIKKASIAPYAKYRTFDALKAKLQLNKTDTKKFWESYDSTKDDVQQLIDFAYKNGNIPKKLSE